MFVARPPLERFWEKVNKTDSCWLWTGVPSRDGYGRFVPGVGVKVISAHRYSYTIHKGEIPPGMQVDHLCRVRNCVNPAHLEAVTQQENMRRGLAAVLHRAYWATVTHCKRGHEFTPENTCKRASGRRMCRACNRLRQGPLRSHNIISNTGNDNHVKQARLVVKAGE